MTRDEAQRAIDEHLTVEDVLDKKHKDPGRIIALNGMAGCRVAWSSGVRTWMPLKDLRFLDGAN